MGMLITFLLVRIPRFIFYIQVRRIPKDAGRREAGLVINREFVFRKWSAIIYLPLAFCFQVLTSITSYCVYDLGQTGDPETCRNLYILVFGILLIAHTIIDYLIYHFVVKDSVQSRIREHTK